MKPQIYVGCALTLAPQSFRDLVGDFKARLAENQDIEILEFIGLVNGTATDVYDYDLGNVRKCSMMIAFADEPSIGLGMELQLATSIQKPILCLHQADKKITRMLIGAHDKNLLDIKPYQTIEDALESARRFISKTRSYTPDLLEVLEAIE